MDKILNLKEINLNTFQEIGNILSRTIDDINHIPEQFKELADTGRRMGFGHVSAGPLVRTSYCAAEIFSKLGNPS